MQSLSKSMWQYPPLLIVDDSPTLDIILHHIMAKIVIEKGMCNVTEVWGSEVPLYFPELYAGTTDCVGVHLGDESILDFKQTNKPKKI